MYIGSPHQRSLGLGLALSASVILCSMHTTPASAAEIVPQTTIRLSVVQWMPTKGAYERWDALGGDFVVSDNRTVSLPVLGTVSVSDLDESALAAKIADLLKKQIGLMEKPEASVTIVDYPPVYVVGDVTTPGAYAFRKGLTALQSLALAGGEYRQTGNLTTAFSQIEFLGEMRELEESIIRSKIRLSRLEAEMAGAKTFGPRPDKDQELATSIYEQEKLIFTSRAAVVERQSQSYRELRELMTQEIGTLEQKIGNNDEDIEAVRKELSVVKPMVDKGVVLPSRQVDLERALRGYQASRLDMVTAIMRARQNIAEATRSLEGLTDNRQAEVAAELQTERGSLNQLQLKREIRQRQLTDAMIDGPMEAQSRTTPIINYTISRRSDGKVAEFSASEATPLQPGDVVRVTRSRSNGGEHAAKTAESVTAERAPTEQASQ